MKVAKCETLLEQLKDRAIKQIAEAYEILTRRGEGYRYHDTDGNGKPIDYDGCIGGWCIVIRKGIPPYYEDGEEELLYRNDYGWRRLTDHDNVSVLAIAADNLLKKAWNEI